MEKSRAIELLEHLAWDRDIERNPYGDALNMAIEALKAQLLQGTTSDTISRQAAIDAIVQCTNCGDEDTLRGYVLKHNLDNGWTGGILEALDAVKDLPPAQPEPKEGHWIPHESPDGGEQYECSECGVLWEFTDGTPEDNEAYFCPKCGAKMKGAEHETN